MRVGEDATASPAVAASPNPFAPQHCPDCGYSLTGLAPAGRCPECGTPYDETMIVIYGFGAGRQSTTANRRVSERTWVRVLGTVLPGLIFLYLWLSKAGGGFMVIYLGVYVAAALYGGWRRRAITSPMPAQVRLLPDGFAQRNGFGAVTPVPWTTRGLWMRLYRTRKDRFELHAERRWLALLTGKTWVGIEFTSTGEVAEQLARQIEVWIQHSGHRGRLEFRPLLPWYRRPLW